jgi:cell division protein FtsL
MTEVEKKVVEKKVVSRNVAIALGIIVIILAVGLVGAIANYTSIISGKDNTIATQNSEIADKNSTITSLNSQISSLSDTVNLAKSTIWVNALNISQSAGSYTNWTFSANYSGYVSVYVRSSTTSNTYVEVIWSYAIPYCYCLILYDNKIPVGTSGGVYFFPVLPAGIEIIVGNTNLSNGATETVTITYYY